MGRTLLAILGAVLVVLGAQSGMIAAAAAADLVAVTAPVGEDSGCCAPVERPSRHSCAIEMAEPCDDGDSECPVPGGECPKHCCKRVQAPTMHLEPVRTGASVLPMRYGVIAGLLAPATRSLRPPSPPPKVS
jgi:hypothetical protein